MHFALVQSKGTGLTLSEQFHAVNVQPIGERKIRSAGNPMLAHAGAGSKPGSLREVRECAATASKTVARSPYDHIGSGGFHWNRLACRRVPVMSVPEQSDAASAPRRNGQT
jgi:hypothetical protein